MEPNFQTSFIPKKPILEEKTVSNPSVGIFMLIAVFVLFVTLVGTGGLFFYRSVESAKIVKMKAALELLKMVLSLHS